MKCSCTIFYVVHSWGGVGILQWGEGSVGGGGGGASRSASGCVVCVLFIN